MLEEKARRRLRAWRRDWCLFASEVLRVRLDEEQRSILRAVQTEKRVAVSSGTARGKDFVAACAAMCFMYLTPRWRDGILEKNTKIAMTAPTARQVYNIMIPEVSRLFRQASFLPGRLMSDGIRTDSKEWFLTGFKAESGNREAWSGFHASNTMFIVTEATGISDDTFEAIEGNLQGNSRLLLVFNPNTSTGYAARALKSERFVKFRLNSLTAPNVVEHRMVIQGQVDYAWVVDKLETWCVRIDRGEMSLEEDDFEFEGKCYRPNDTFRVKVLGVFPKSDEDALIPRQWLEAAHERWRSRAGVSPADNHSPYVMGVDVAGMGRDATVMFKRRGTWVDKPIVLRGNGEMNHMQTAGRIVSERRTCPYLYVSIDTIGEGAGVYSRCVEMERGGSYILSCKYSEAARQKGKDLTDMTGQVSFANMRAYLFWSVREWLDPRNDTGASLPPCDVLDEEATEIHYMYRSDGRIQIESKDAISSRLGHSTDYFDALANSFYPIMQSVAGGTRMTVKVRNND